MIKKIGNYLNKVFVTDECPLNPFIREHYKNLNDKELENAYIDIRTDYKKTEELIDAFKDISDSKTITDEVKNYINNEIIEDLKYHNDTNKEVIKLIKKRGKFKMYEYLINVKSTKENNYFREKNFYIEADSSEEALIKAIDFFMEDEDINFENAISTLGIETKVVSYSEADYSLEEEIDEEINEDDNIENLTYNITINSIHNEEDLKKISK